MNDASPLARVIAGESPEVSISRDLVRRGLIAAPVVVAVGAVFGGGDGALSAAFALAVVLANFALAAGSLAVTARISLALMMGAALFGYLIRLGLIFLAVWLVRDAPWVSLPVLGGTLIVAHLGLLGWELKYVAASLAYPGLKPGASTRDATHVDVGVPFRATGPDRQESPEVPTRPDQRRTNRT